MQQKKARICINFPFRAERVCLGFLISLPRCEAKWGQGLKAVSGQTSKMRPDSITAPPVLGGSSFSQLLPP